jgi:cytochrome c553
MRLQTLTCLVLVAVLSPNLASATGDPAAGRQKAQTCGACHGADGNSVNPAWPNLAGQGAEYIAKQLMDFRSGARKNDQMSPMAANLSDGDIADLAAFLSGQKPKIGSADPALIDSGQKIWRAGNAANGLPACMACHGPSGAGNPAAAYPALMGQHAPYTATQLKAFKAEQRANDNGAVMRAIAAKMTNADIDAVSAYIQGLH